MREKGEDSSEIQRDRELACVRDDGERRREGERSEGRALNRA